MSLLALQRDMRAWLTVEDSDAAARLEPGGTAGLSIYLNTYRAQLVACLEDSFAVARAWIGESAFHHAVVRHVDRLPPSSWTLDAYGRDFPATLAALYPDDPEVAELAWIDLALDEAFVAPDVGAAPGDLSAIDWDRAVLRFSPSLDIGPLATNAPAIWSALTQEQMPPAVVILPEPGAILVWRQGETARFRAVDQYERQALLMARAGQPFSQLCAAITEAIGEDAGIAEAGRMLGQWLTDGLVTTIEEPKA